MRKLRFGKFLVASLLALLGSIACFAQSTQTLTAGSGISVGQIVSLNSSGQVVPIAAGATSGAYGIAIGSGPSGSQILVLLEGSATVSVDGACAIGNIVEVSPVTFTGNGHCVSSSPTTQVIGTATSASAAASSIAVQVSALSSAGTSSSGGLPGGGNIGQALINTAPGSGTWQDPNISNTPMVLFTAVAATGTQTSVAVKIPVQSASGSLVITGASIAGAPAACQIVLELQQSTGAPASAAVVTQAFTPGNSYQSFFVIPANPVFTSGDNLIAVYTCGTYPTGGTITVTFSPVNSMFNTGGVVGASNGISVTTGDWLVMDVTVPGALGTLQYGFNYRIQTPQGTIVNNQSLSTAFSLGAGPNYVPIQVSTNGLLIGATLQITGGTYIPASGTMYYNLFLMNSPGGNPCSAPPGTCNTTPNIPGGVTLIGSPIALNFPVTWSGGTALYAPPTAGPGTVAYTTSTPGAGAEATFTNTINTRSQILGIWLQLVTSATVANRNFVLVPAGSQNAPWIPSPIFQPASTTWVYAFTPGSGELVQTPPGAATNLIQIPMETLIFQSGNSPVGNGALCGGTNCTIKTQTTNLQAGDTYTMIVTYQSWNDLD